MVESSGWNGKWTLHLDCPAGVTSSDGPYIKCNETVDGQRWSDFTNPGGWLKNATDKTAEVRATAKLIGESGAELLATDEAIIVVPPAQN